MSENGYEFTADIAEILNKKKLIPAKIVKDDEFYVKIINKPVKVRTSTKSMQITDEEPERPKFSKRYISKCYFKPVPNPVSYSETVIVNTNTKKKQYFETVIYETKMVPTRWRETMEVLNLPFAPENCSRSEIHIEKPQYVSLEAQQVVAK